MSHPHAPCPIHSHRWHGDGEGEVGMGREMGPWHGDLTVKKRKSEKIFAKLFVAWGNGAWENGKGE